MFHSFPNTFVGSRFLKDLRIILFFPDQQLLDFLDALPHSLGHKNEHQQRPRKVDPGEDVEHRVHPERVRDGVVQHQLDRH